MWQGFKEFSTYTRRQRNGIYLFLLLILILWGSVLVDDYFYVSEPSDFSDFEKAIALWEAEDSLMRFERHNKALFPFDPNKANDSVWEALGLSQRQAQILQNYKSKGGQFYRFSDLEKMYSLDSAWLFRVKPYAVFPEPERMPRNSGKKEFTFRSFDPNTVSVNDLMDMGLYEWQAKRIQTYREKVKPFGYSDQLYTVYGLDTTLVERMIPFVRIDTSLLSRPRVKKEVLAVFELNTADSLQLLKVKGIGPAFAHRILSYRDRLGGFYTKEQLMEVYGMDEERYQDLVKQLTVDSSRIKKLSLNSSSFKEMLKNPYLTYEMVRAIFNFREKVRPFKSVSEVENLEGFTKADLKRLNFYLSQ